MFIFIVLGDRPSGLLFLCSLYLFPYSRLSSYIFMFFFVSNFILAVPMRECLGKHSYQSSTFPLAILNGTCLFARRIIPLAKSLHIKNKVS